MSADNEKVPGSVLLFILVVCIVVSTCSVKFAEDHNQRVEACQKLGGTLVKNKCLKEIKLEKQ